MKTKSSFSSAFIALHKEQFATIQSAKCCCAGKNHTFFATRNKPVCGYIGRGFIQNAKRNHYSLMSRNARNGKFGNFDKVLPQH